MLATIITAPALPSFGFTHARSSWLSVGNSGSKSEPGPEGFDVMAGVVLLYRLGDEPQLERGPPAVAAGGPLIPPGGGDRGDPAAYNDLPFLRDDDVPNEVALNGYP